MKLTPLPSKTLKNLDATAATAGLNPCVLMERAGMALAAFLEGRLKGKEKVCFLCGPGNNGGDGFVAARHLAHKGFPVEVICTSKRRKGVAKDNRRLLDVVGVPLHDWEDRPNIEGYDVLVDCLLGYGPDSEPRGAVAEVVEKARATKATVYACDTPTGLGTDTGEVYENHLACEATVTFSAPKQGFSKKMAKAVIGEVVVVGIGIPAQVYEQNGLKKGTFLIEGTAEIS